MEIKSRVIQHTFRNKYLKYAGSGSTVTNSSSGSSGTGSSSISKWFYEDEDGNLHSKLNFIGDSEISAYGVGDGSTSTGGVTIIDSLDSVAADCALSANQGRILKELIDDTAGASKLLSSLEDVTLTNLADSQILKYDAASEKWVNADGTKVTWTNIEGKPADLTDANIAKWHENTHSNKATLDKITEANLTSWNNKLDKAIWDEAFYFDDAGDLRAKVNVIGEKEISAYGVGTTSGAGTVTIVDALTSTATDCALSANMGRILKDMIDSKGSVSSWEDIIDKPSWITSTKPSYGWNEITSKPSTFTPSEHTHNYASSVKIGNTAYNAATNVISLPAYPTLSSLGAVSSTDFSAHTGNTTLHITATERTNWNDANNKKHSHSNKAVLDGITSAKVTSWDGVVTNWNKAFYFDSNGDLKVKVNLIGEKEVSAYGAGASGGSGSITIVDALTSTATDAALSANQGRILKELIDNVGGGVSSWNDLTDKPSTFTPSAHTHTIANITNLQTILDGKAASNHTHNYTSTVKVGSTSYNVSGNTISLPAYPTVPSALKNPNALTISLNGTSQGAYDGSAAKSFNITAASVGAAPSSHSHSYLPLSGGTLTGNVTFSTDSTLTWSRNTDNFSMGFKNTGDSDADSYGWMKMADNGNEYFKWLQVSGSTTTELMSLKSDGLRFKGTKVSLEGHTHSQYLTSYTNNYLTGVSGSGNGTVTFTRNGLGNLTWNASHSHSYAGSSSVGGAATSANKVNSTLAFTGGAFAAKSFNGSSNQTVNVPTHTSHLTNNSGYITSSATVAAANKVTNTLTFTGYQSKSFNGSAAVSVAIPNNTNQLTNGAGFITSSASISGNAGSATKLQTARTIWGQSFNGTANVSGNMTGVGTISATGINTITRDSYEMINLKRTTNNGAAIGFYNNTSTKIGVLGVSANGWLCFDSKTTTDAVQINNSGTIIAKGDVTAYSDVRLKTNILPLENRGYITPVTYKKDGKDSIGFIAQEVREKYPELVVEDNTEDKYLAVNYAQYVAVLQAQIIELNNRIKQLEKWHYQVQE